MVNETEMTAPVVSVGADTEQPSQICTVDSISETATENKTSEESFEELLRKVSRYNDPAYLPTV